MKGIMTGHSGGRFATGIAVLTLVGAACNGYDRNTTTGPGYEDSTDQATVGGALISEAAGRSKFRVFAATGEITTTLADFRTALGAQRVIKWDGVPANLLNVDTFPGNFFNTTAKLGALFTTDGTGFRNSNTDFSDINPDYADEFNAFSPLVTFMPIGSASLATTFRVPGTETPAATRGFGIVFSDVERAGAASIKLFDAAGRSLGQYHAPIRSDPAGFSFVGVVFESPIVAEVRITAGQRALGADVQDLSDGGNLDLVVTDDFLFAEPQALP